MHNCPTLDNERLCSQPKHTPGKLLGLTQSSVFSDVGCFWDIRLARQVKLPIDQYRTNLGQVRPAHAQLSVKSQGRLQTVTQLS